MKPTVEQIEQAVIAVLRSDFYIEAVTPQTPLSELNMDSLDRVDIAIAIEDELGIEIDDYGVELLTDKDTIHTASEKVWATL